MRHLIYLLAVVNLLYFIWHTVQGPTAGEVVLPPLPKNVTPLVTLDEREAARAAEMNALTAAEPPGAGIPGCLALGPFLSREALQSAERRLEDAGYATVSRTAEEDVKVGYWIYMPSMEREKADGIVDMLESRRDREFYLGADNLISLGAFKEMWRATIRLEELREYGLNPTLEPRYRQETVHWLDVTGLPRRNPLIREITQEYPGIRQPLPACG